MTKRRAGRRVKEPVDTGRKTILDSAPEVKTDKADAINRRLLFARYWCGSISRTLDMMHGDGIALSHETAREYLRDPGVVRMIEQTFERKAKTIATRDDRARFWSCLMNDVFIPFEIRLRASELLGKMQMDFVERVEIDHKVELSLAALIASEPKKECLFHSVSSIPDTAEASGESAGEEETLPLPAPNQINQIIIRKNNNSGSEILLSSEQKNSEILYDETENPNYENDPRLAALLE